MYLCQYYDPSGSVVHCISQVHLLSKFKKAMTSQIRQLTMERDTAYQKIETLEGQLAKADRVNQELCKVL